MPRDPDAGPANIAPVDLSADSGDAAIGPPDAASDDAKLAPDPEAWGCYIDEHCAVFPTLPYCDGHRCAPAERSVVCAPEVRADTESPEVRHTYTGSNGAFEDACDAQGNLIDYQCETTFRCTNYSFNNVCLLYETGLVALPGSIDCAGACRDGRCDGRCPQQGDAVTFLHSSGDGGAVIRNDTDGRTYGCTLISDYPTDNFDCKSVREGQTARLPGGIEDYHCTGADFGSVSVALDGIPRELGAYHCAYTCGIRPTAECAPR